MLTDEQLTLRRNGVTGTDISAIMGVNPWKRPIDVFSDKQFPMYKTVTSPAMEWGNKLEPVVFAEFQSRNPEVECERNDKTKIDGIYVGTPDGIGEDCIIEIKTAASNKGWENRIPVHYELQLRWYMMIFKKQKGHLAVLFGGNDYCQYTIEREPDIEVSMRAAAEDFWAALKAGMPPKEGMAFGDVWIHFPPEEEDKYVVGEDSTAQMYLEMIAENNHAIKSAQEANEKAKLALVKITGGAKTLVNEEGKSVASYLKVERGPSLDSKRLKKEHPDVYRQCLGDPPKPYATLRVYEKNL